MQELRLHAFGSVRFSRGADVFPFTASVQCLGFGSPSCAVSAVLCLSPGLMPPGCELTSDLMPSLSKCVDLCCAPTSVFMVR